MKWEIKYTHEAVHDLQDLDHSQQIQVLKAIRKVSVNPLPSTQGGYGKPLGNQSTAHLAGYLKIKLARLGIRVVYKLEIVNEIMKIVIISVREDEKVYKILEERIKKKRNLK
jgi:mRNA interferase RelE/StbE